MFHSGETKGFMFTIYRIVISTFRTTTTTKTTTSIILTYFFKKNPGRKMELILIIHVMYSRKMTWQFTLLIHELIILELQKLSLQTWMRHTVTNLVQSMA